MSSSRQSASKSVHFHNNIFWLQTQRTDERTIRECFHLSVWPGGCTIKLEGHSVERMYLRQRCFDGSVNKTILKPRLAAAAGHPYVYVGFSRRKIPRSSAYTESNREKAIGFRHSDYDPDRAQKLISSSMSWHLSTRNISSTSIACVFE